MFYNLHMVDQTIAKQQDVLLGIWKYLFMVFLISLHSLLFIVMF